ncbi:MAG: branched-chain amino acid aminotransferase [Thiotrichales bacterium]|nr:branched-chain amino acid aminotransferase [Thiotrichales bacterium]
MSMLPDITFERVPRSRREDVDFDNLGFGNVFSDHMFSMEWEDGAWRHPRIIPYGPIAMEPCNATLHYGQSVFEGMKAFRGADGRVRIFRPDMNARRLEASCDRLCVPRLDPEMFVAAAERLVTVDQAWIPARRGESLYIRPIIFSNESHLEVRPSRTFRLLVMTSPVRSYFDESMPAVTLKVEDTYTRAAPGGTGAAKTAGNYAGSLYPAELARREGYMQVLWLDGVEHRYVEEVGAMNIFFRIDGRVVTPELRGSILPGITRDAVITLLRENGHDVVERRITIDEVVDASRKGMLEEAFGAGTAAVISPVGTMAYKGEEIRVNANASGPVTQWLYDRITGIQLGEHDDPHGWCRVLPV